MHPGRSVAPPLILLTCITAVLAGPLFCGSSLAWAQLDASRQSAFRLVGTIEGGPFTGAVIDDTKNPQAFYRLHDKLPDESQIVKVEHNHIVLKWPDGTKMELYTTPGAGNGSVPASSPAPASYAAPAVSPQYVAPRQTGQPTPERRSINPNGRIAPGQAAPSANSDDEDNPASRRVSRKDRLNLNRQNNQVQDPVNNMGVSKGRRNRPRSGGEE